MNKKIVFLCGARDFHAMDWYFSAKKSEIKNDICILTDLIEAEGYKKLINDNDDVSKLIIIDKILFKKQSKIGHYWRNIVKLTIFPFQVYLIKKYNKRNPNSLYHAHSMYYLFLAWAANVKYIGTPQGSDILIKPYKSYLYRYFAKKSLKSASIITVDSIKMKNKVSELIGVESIIIQNGIDIDKIYEVISIIKNSYRDRILSVRGITSLYRIKEIIQARDISKNHNKSISFVYPFFDDKYRNEVKSILSDNDNDIGRVNREEMYRILNESILVISIPTSDSSPRSVYESIFCGCAVAITYNRYYDDLPECMKSRIIIVDLNNENWFDYAINKANEIISDKFVPTIEAIELFDQQESFNKLLEIYKNI